MNGILSKPLNGQLVGALVKALLVDKWGHKSSKCNNADGHLAACASGGPRSGDPQIRHSRVVFLDKVAYIACETRLAVTNLRAT